MNAEPAQSQLREVLGVYGLSARGRAELRTLVSMQLQRLASVDPVALTVEQRQALGESRQILQQFLTDLDQADTQVRAAHLLRDGMQSTQADGQWEFDPTRIESLLRQTVEAGFTSAEVGGGQSFQMALSQGYNPFDVVRAARRGAGPEFNLQMLLRGVNGLGFRPYGADVLNVLIRLHAKAGINIMRNFDALNNIRNVQLPLDKARSEDADVLRRVHFQGAMCFTTYAEAPARYTDEYYVEYARELATAGYRSIAIKDMSGQLTAERVAQLLPKLKNLKDDDREIALPVYLHIHATNFIDSLATVKAALAAGIDGVEFAVRPIAGGASHHDIQSILEDPQYAGKIKYIDEDSLENLEGDMERTFGDRERKDMKLSDAVRTEFCRLGVPGGAIPSVISDLETYYVPKLIGQHGLHQAYKLAREIRTSFVEQIDIPHAQIFAQAVQDFGAELAQVCRDAGYPPLVTPTADIVCKQAIFNLISGRYANIEPRFAGLVFGEYGEMRDYATGAVTYADDELLHQVLRQYHPDGSKRIQAPNCLNHTSGHDVAEIHNKRAQQLAVASDSDEMTWCYTQADALIAACPDLVSHFAPQDTLRDELAILYAMHPSGKKVDLVREAILATAFRKKAAIVDAFWAMRPAREADPHIALHGIHWQKFMPRLLDQCGQRLSDLAHEYHSGRRTEQEIHTAIDDLIESESQKSADDSVIAKFLQKKTAHAPHVHVPLLQEYIADQLIVLLAYQADFVVRQTDPVAAYFPGQHFTRDTQIQSSFVSLDHAVEIFRQEQIPTANTSGLQKRKNWGQPGTLSQISADI